MPGDPAMHRFVIYDWGMTRTGETSYEVRSHVHLALCSSPEVAKGWDIQGEHMSLGIFCDPFCGPFSLASKRFLS